MNILSFLKGPKTVEKVLDAAIKGADALILTDEERIQYNQKSTELYLKQIELVNKESSPTSLSRRVIAWGALGCFSFLEIGSAIFYAFGATDIAEHWQTLAAEDYGVIVMICVGFYFGSHVVKGFKK